MFSTPTHVCTTHTADTVAFKQSCFNNTQRENNSFLAERERQIVFVVFFEFAFTNAFVRMGFFVFKRFALHVWLAGGGSE